MLFNRMKLIAAVAVASCSFSINVFGQPHPSTSPPALSHKIAPPTDAFAEQRAKYLQAQRAWALGNSSQYRQLKSELTHYPLKIYLDFNELAPRLSSLPLKDVDQFFTEHGETVPSIRLRYRLLAQLAEKQRWKDYINYFTPAINETEYRCNFLRARLITGDKTALKEVAPLWNIDRNQVKACDPLFTLWRKAGGQTPELTWERFLKVSARQDKALAGFLQKQLPTSYQAAATRVQNAYVNPKIIRQNPWPIATPFERDAVSVGIDRLARVDASDALAAWKKYETSTSFSTEEKKSVNKNIAIRYLFQKNDSGARALAIAHPDIRDGDLIEWILRERLRQLDFESLYEWLAYLPEELQQHERWQYWRARAMDELKIKEANNSSAREIYQKLKTTRSFYGFAAADILNSPYALQDQPVTFSEPALKEVLDDGSVKRAREFLLLEDATSANREWNYALRHFSQEQRKIAGRVALNWQWHRQGIQSMIQANYWDDLTVRFPTQYQDIVTQNAKQTGLSPVFIYSIIRQESAFIPDARSPVGATGLMQLMPATAAETAKRNKVAYQPSDLINPSKNIALGSRFLKQMMDRFNHNRLLTAAAYNAGPNRVNQWFSPDKSLPADVWIETIPFRETRGYVQNILSFSVIYSYRLGEQPIFLTANEKKQKL